MTQTRLLGPKQYRSFMRLANNFFRIMPWLWFVGIGACLAVPIFSIDKLYGITLEIICAVTIWPAILGWLTINGFGIVWKFALRVESVVRRRDKPGALAAAYIISILLAGIVFLGCAAIIFYTLLGNAFSNT